MTDRFRKGTHEKIPFICVICLFLATFLAKPTPCLSDFVSSQEISGYFHGNKKDLDKQKRGVSRAPLCRYEKEQLLCECPNGYLFNGNITYEPGINGVYKNRFNRLKLNCTE